MNMNFKRKLPIPKEVKEMYPLTREMEAVKSRRDAEISGIVTGKSDKFLLIVGPCSADREEPVMEYLSRLARVQEEVSGSIVIVPRLYTSKPRSSGTGYMGFLHQQDPSDAPDIYNGITQVREFHLRALSETGFTCADELLYPDNHRYLSDLLSYVAVGARSVLDQQHRLTASGLNIPVGMKNPIGGGDELLLDSIGSAQMPHEFLYRGWEVESRGNPLTHAILRGWKDENGVRHQNCGRDELLRFNELYLNKGLSNPCTIVDVNHDNSGKDWTLEPSISMDVLESRRREPVLAKFVRGLMIESYLKDGCQDESGTEYGMSVTDPCIGWEKTEKLIYEIAEKL